MARKSGVKRASTATRQQKASRRLAAPGGAVLVVKLKARVNKRTPGQPKRVAAQHIGRVMVAHIQPAVPHQKYDLRRVEDGQEAPAPGSAGGAGADTGISPYKSIAVMECPLGKPGPGSGFRADRGRSAGGAQTSSRAPRTRCCRRSHR